MYELNDARIEVLAKPALAGDCKALAELREIYRSGQFDPGFGRELAALFTNADKP